MNLNDAIRVLRKGGQLAELAEAVGIVISSPSSSLFDIALGLKYGGVVADQAALALYKRTGKKIPEDRSQLIVDIQPWMELITSKLWSSEDSPPPLDLRFVDASVPTASAASPFDLKKVQDFIAHHLSREDRLLLILYYFEEMKVKEIARVLGVTESAIVKGHKRILSTIRQELASNAEPISQLFRDLVA